MYNNHQSSKYLKKQQVLKKINLKMVCTAGENETNDTIDFTKNTGKCLVKYMELDLKPIEEEKISVIYSGSYMIGWCQTWQEADYICEKKPMLQWEMKKKTKVSDVVPQMISSIILK